MSNVDLKILCLDDEPEVLAVYHDAVVQAGFTPILCSDPDEAIQAIRSEIHNIAIILCDFKMPKMNGFEFRTAIMTEASQIPFVVISGHVTKDMALKALELKIASFQQKPIVSDMIAGIIEKEGAKRIESIRENQMLEGVFVEEASVIVEDMEPVLLSLEQDRGNQDSLNNLYRAAHTLKGASGVLETQIFAKYIHKYEDVISALRKSQMVFTDEVYAIMLRGYDRIKELLASLGAKTIRKYNLEEIFLDLKPKSAAVKVEEKAATSPASKEADAAKQKPKDSISVPIHLLDDLSASSGEITVIRNMVNKIVRSLEKKYAGEKDIQSLGELFDEMHKINSTIQVRITDLRKVPVSGVLKPVPRILRDLSKDLGKKIKFHVDGEKLRLDNSLAQVCNNSIIHLIRNSADHGMETPAERVQAGKPEEGNVTVTCTEDHEKVTIAVRDDGRGIDAAKIKARALEKGLYTQEQLDAMRESQILGLIFASGFSTAAVVTDVSGRGVGMDMVKSSVESVGGRIDIDTKIGKGTTFTLELPIPRSVLIINSLLVECNGRHFAIAQDSIVRVLRIEPENFATMVQSVASGRILRIDQTVYPLLDLNAILGLKARDGHGNGGKTIDILILRSETTVYALLVGEIHDIEEIVLKQLPACFNASGLYAGATFMGDATVGIILDPAAVARAGGLKAAVSEEALTKPDLASTQSGVDAFNYVLFKLNSASMFGVPLESVFRLEELDNKSFQSSGARRVTIYRDHVMPVVSLDKLLGLNPRKVNNHVIASEKTPTLVFQSGDSFVGLEVAEVVDIATADDKVSQEIRDRVGVMGNTFIRNQTVTIIDIAAVMRRFAQTAA